MFGPRYQQIIYLLSLIVHDCTVSSLFSATQILFSLGLIIIRHRLGSVATTIFSNSSSIIPVHFMIQSVTFPILLISSLQSLTIIRYRLGSIATTIFSNSLSFPVKLLSKAYFQYGSVRFMIQSVSFPTASGIFLISNH